MKISKNLREFWNENVFLSFFSDFVTFLSFFIQLNDPLSAIKTENSLKNESFYDLLMSVQTKSKTNKLAADEYGRKFASKPIFINGTSLSKEVRRTVYESNSHISIRSYDLLKLALQTFGRKMKILIISYEGIESKKREEIHRLIDQYCSRSLIEMNLLRMDENVLRHFKNPLKNIERLTLDGEMEAQQTSLLQWIFARKVLKLDDIFPNLLRLRLNNMNIRDKSLLDVHFWQLNYVKIVLVPEPFNRPVIDFIAPSKPAIENLFIKNPKIVNLVLQNVNSLDYLEIASKLPNLHLFEVKFSPFQQHYSGQVIQFKTVKKLALKMHTNINLDEMAHFDQVEDLTLMQKETCGREFPVNNTAHLKTLIIIGSTFNGSGLLQPDRKFPNLTDLFISNRSPLKSKDVIEFIEDNEQLERLRLINIEEDLPETLEEQFEKGWIMTQKTNALVMQKKILTKWHTKELNRF